MNARTQNWQGHHWIRPSKRLAIYLRDGLACVYCGDSVDGGAKLTLDHVIPVSKGGDNDQSNLVTACSRCNYSRGNRDVRTWVKAVAAYLDHDLKWKDILKFVLDSTARPLDMATAKVMIERRGTVAKALYLKREAESAC